MVKYRMINTDGSWQETLSIEEAQQFGNYVEIEFELVTEEETDPQI
jgi:adenylate cyclase class IV